VTPAGSVSKRLRRVASSPPRRLEQLDRIAVRVLQLDLFAPRSHVHLIPETEPGLLQRLDTSGKIRYSEDDSVPATGLLMTTVWERTGPRSSGAAEQNLKVIDRDAGERGQLLVFQSEPEVTSVERDGTADVLHLIPHAVKSENEVVRSTCARGSLI
jgi:hypothetical protein